MLMDFVDFESRMRDVSKEVACFIYSKEISSSFSHESGDVEVATEIFFYLVNKKG